MTSLIRITITVILVTVAGISHAAPPVDEVRRASDRPLPDAPVKVATADWPWWRGQAGDGEGRGDAPPVKWGKSENVAWSAAIPGRGHSSPIVWGTQVILTTAEEVEQRQSILAFDRATGERLWTTAAHTGGFLRKHGKNSHASATPACDGERVYAAFMNAGDLWMTATDLGGKILWQEKAGPYRSEHGYGSSPILYKSLLIVAGDDAASGYVTAMDRSTGKIAWRTARETPGRHANYATPAIVTLAGKPQLVLVGLGVVASYDPDTGKPIWHCKGPAEVAACTPAFSDTMIFASAGFPEKEILAIKADGSGDVSESHIVWRSKRNVTYVPSPLYHDGDLYVVTDSGIVACLDAATGKEKWQDRLRGAFSASPVLAAGRLYIPNEAGRCFVFNAAPKFELLSENDLGDGGFASPVICGGRIYLRTEHHLYCIGTKAKP